MAYEIPGFLYTLEAAADHSANQHRFVSVNGTGQAALAAAGAYVAGVLQNNPATVGEAATIMGNGITKVVAGAAVAQGALVASNATGQAVTAATGNHVAGVALQAAANAGELISVLLERSGQLN